MDPHLIHGSLDQPEYSTQTASRSVRLFAGLTTVQTDRQTEDDATRSVTIGCIYVRRTAMGPKNKYVDHIDVLDPSAECEMKQN